jgi:transposase
MADKHIDVIEFNKADLRAKAAGASEAVMRRVEAVIAVSNGEDPRQLAVSLGVEHLTIVRWVRAFNDGGFEELANVKVGKTVDMRSDYDSGRLLKLATDAHFPETRVRLTALSGLYEGETLASVALTFGVSKAVVTRWRDDFNRKGVDLPSLDAVKLEADISASTRSEIRTVAEIVGKLEGEHREKAEAILMSARDVSVARIAESFARPRSWVVATIKSFNFGGTQDLFNVPNHGRQTTLPQGSTVKSIEGITAKVLMDAAAEQEGKTKEDLTILSKVYLYKNRREAAQVTGASESRIVGLIAKLRAGGLEAFVNEPTYKQLDARKIDEAAKRYQNKAAAAKLFALARIVRGETFESVAENTGATRGVLRALMTKLEKYGVDAIPDGKTIQSVPEKPKAKPVTNALIDSVRPPKRPEKTTQAKSSSSKANESFAARIREAIAASEVGAQSIRPFVSPAQKNMIRSMARDEHYAGRNLAMATLAHLEGAASAHAASKFNVNPVSINALLSNLSPTLERYAEERSKKLIWEAGITSDKVRKVASDCPKGWLSKLRSVGYVAQGKSLREVCALTKLDQATILRYVEDIADGWSEVENRFSQRPKASVAGMQR